MERFLPEYIGTEHLNLPTEKHYKFDILGIDAMAWKVDWTNITYGEP
jgi:hypothetical protein